ncbi:hypothetical protein NOCA2360025 [metagenome]|uniref:Uncharacterized protein n=1 Tax=metagenome TaxID=256318 RepID=A0A2P2C420_9ZZZZ
MTIYKLPFIVATLGQFVLPSHTMQKEVFSHVPYRPRTTANVAALGCVPGRHTRHHLVGTDRLR